MSFKPRVVGQRDDAAEATDDFAPELPPELTALGEQLGVDSTFLAERYPAKRPAAVSQVAEAAAGARSRPAIGFRFGAAAAAILAGVLGWQLGSMQQPSLAKGTDGPAAQPAVVPAPILADASHAKLARPTTAASELHGDQGIQEVAVDAPAHSKHSPADEVTMLRTQLNGFEKVIGILQTELAARKQAEAEDRKLIESLQAELAQFKGEK